LKWVKLLPFQFLYLWHCYVFFFIWKKINPKFSLFSKRFYIFKWSISNFIELIWAVWNEFSEENFFVCIKCIDDGIISLLISAWNFMVHACCDIFYVLSGWTFIYIKFVQIIFILFYIRYKSQWKVLIILKSFSFFFFLFSFHIHSNILRCSL
jgi:hypothetical protein